MHHFVRKVSELIGLNVNEKINKLVSFCDTDVVKMLLLVFGLPRTN